MPDIPVALKVCQWMPYSSHIVLSLLTTLCSLRRQLPVSFKLVRLFLRQTIWKSEAQHQDGWAVYYL
jgi:hypothetical protein